MEALWRSVMDSKYGSLRGEVCVLRRLGGPMVWERGNV
jgi:hypothetical protein